MRLHISASVIALVFALATPAVVQAAQTDTGSSTMHGTSASSASRAIEPNTPASSAAAQQFKSEAEAKSACGSQSVVWANSSSRVLHAAGSQYYGKTKRGAYMCESAAEHAGYHMAKNGQ